jgi:hypothetical protein
VIKEKHISPYMLNKLKQEGKAFHDTKSLVGSYYGDEIVLYTPLLKWYLEHGLEITKFYCAIKYEGAYAFKDFADAERESLALTNTVKNLGLAFDNPAISNYVDQIGKLYGVTGAQATPALQSLLSVTGSVAKSTEIMNVALDLAASRNADVASVASDLSKAYVGNSKALNNYNLGLTKAELAAMTFDEILARIAKDTMGAADEAANSLSGKFAILAEASNKAKERIGGGLVDALGGLAGPNGAGGAAAAGDGLAARSPV